jgi:hypothetical protein
MKAKSALLAALLSTVAVSVATAGELYPLPIQDNAGTPKARAEVVAQTQQAVQSGQIVNGEQSFIAATPASNASRVQVAAETREAQRLGLIANGELGARDASPAELESIRMAGLTAIGVDVAKAAEPGKSE